MTATKADGFPRPLTMGGRVRKYPFAEIAQDGGVWRIDPDGYGVKPVTIRAAAANWAQRHGYRSVTQIQDGIVYVQFVTREADDGGEVAS